MTSDPFELNRILQEAEDKRVCAAKASISDADVGQIKRLLAGLPLLESQRDILDQAAWKICFQVELARQELAENRELLPEWRANIRLDARKPLAGVITDDVAHWFWTLTGKAVTRVSKGVDGKFGLQETGEFAKFLGEVFEAFGIQASTAAQVKMWKDRVDPADLKKQIHPDDFCRIIQELTRELDSPHRSDEAIQKLLQQLRPFDEERR
jgi:hypothetical protein